jgi:hypothetical protein
VVGSLSISASVAFRAEVTVPLVGGGGLLGDLLSLILGRLGLGALLDPPRLILDNTLVLSGGAAGSPFTRDLSLPLPGSYTTPVGSGSGAVIGNVTLQPQASSSLTLRYRPLLSPTTRDLTILSTEQLFTRTIAPVVSGLLSSVVNPLVTRLQDRLVRPLTDLVGVQYGGADVFAVPTPACTSPKLVG